MKKIVKKIIKGYFILDLLCLVFIGISELFEEYDKNPDKSVFSVNDMVMIRTFERFKNHF